MVREQRPSAACRFIVKTSDLVQPIHHNHDKKDYYLGLLMRRIDKAFESSHPLSTEQTMCAFPGKICNCPIIDEDTAFKDNLAVKAILIVATILESFDVVLYSRKECWKLLEAVYKLAKTFHQLKDFPILHHLHEIKNADADPMFYTIFDELRRCFFLKKWNERDRLVLNQSKYKTDIEKYLSQVNEAQEDLGTQMLVCILHSEQPRPQREDEAQSEANIQNEEDKVIKEKKIEVAKDLFLDKDKKHSVAVILRGQCKTTVGDAIYDHLKDKLFEHGFKFAKVKVAENLESSRDNDRLQRQILDELREKNKYSSTNIDHMLRDVIEKEPVFIYMDNILSVQDLRSILKMELMHPKKFRLLITSPNDTVLLALEKWGFVVAASNLIKDDPDIDIKCSKDPLLREMVTDYLKRCKGAGKERCKGADKESVCKWVEEKNLVEIGFRFALENAFLNLVATAQEAFLDICSFFLGWDFDEVSYIVGEVEVKALEQNAWVKRNRHNQIVVPARAREWALERSKGVRLTRKDELKSALSSEETIPNIKGIWLSDTERKTAKIPTNEKHVERIKQENRVEEELAEILAEKLRLMSDSLRVLFMERVPVVAKLDQSVKCPNKIDDPGQINATAQEQQQREQQIKFQNLRFLHVDGYVLPFRINQLSNLKYLSCGDYVDFCVKERRYTIEEELKDLRNYMRGSRLDMRTLKLKTFCKLSSSMPNIFRPFPKLRELSINIWSETFPRSLSELYYLKKLDLHDCKYLQDLPNSFGNLRCLTKLDLGYCQSLKRLPETFGELQSLEELLLTCCVALEELPASFVWLGGLKKATFSQCHSLKKLPPMFDLLSSLQEVDFSYCSNLTLLPQKLQRLSSLQLLNLNGCTKLEKIPDSLPESLLNSEWVGVKLCGCSGLTQLPDEFCQGNQIEDLSLAHCSNLKTLPSKINEMKGLKKLNLSGCKNLIELPKSFRELSCLQVLNLSLCQRLLALCKGFNRLKALKDLNISGCPNLEGKWMTKLEKNKSLRLVDIGGSIKLQDQWQQSMSNRKSVPHFTVQHQKEPPKHVSQKTESTKQVPDQREPTQSSTTEPTKEVQDQIKSTAGPTIEITKQGKQKSDPLENALDKAAAMFFQDRVVLVDPHGMPFFPSRDIKSGTTLAIIFDNNISRWDLEMVENIVDELILNFSEMKIIYVGNFFSAIPSGLAENVSAYTLENSAALSFFDKPVSLGAGEEFWVSSIYIIKTNVVKDFNGHPQFRDWENITGKLDTRCFEMEENNKFIKEIQTREKGKPREVNDILGEALCTTTKNEPEEGKVEFSKLNQKVVFLLISTLEISDRQICFFKAMYSEMFEVEMPNRSSVSAIWVWVPVVNGDKAKWLPAYSRLAECMPWAVISDPWSIDQSSLKLFLRERLAFYETPILVGLIPGFVSSLTNVMPIVAALGLKAFLFLLDSSYSTVDNLERQAIGKGQSGPSFMFLEFHRSTQGKGLSRPSFLFQEFHRSTEGNIVQHFILQEIYLDRLSKCRMIWLYGGDGDLIKQFYQKLKYVSEEVVEGTVEIVYVGNGKEDGEDMYKEVADGVSGMKLSFGGVESFWKRVAYLMYLKACSGGWTSVASESRVLQGLLSVDCLSRRNGTVWMMAIDGNNNEIITGRGRELVDLLSSNIENSKKSSMRIGKGVVEVSSSKTKQEEKPWIRVIEEGENSEGGKASGGEMENSGQQTTVDENSKSSQAESISFENDPWLTAHPSSHLVERIPDYSFCSMCYWNVPAYKCNVCHRFNICQECYTFEEERAVKTYMEKG